MKVINRDRNGNNQAGYYTAYSFDTGHFFRQWDDGIYFAYTPKGNYASQQTAHKLIKLASQYEDNRQQVPA